MVLIISNLYTAWAINLKSEAMKLLNRSIGLYILYAVILMAIAVPAIYFAIQHRVAEEVDENLVEQKARIINRLEKSDSTSLAQWLQNIEPDIIITPSAIAKAEEDRFYTITSYDKIVKEQSPYRVLETAVVLTNRPYTIQIKSSLIDSEDLIESIVKIVALLLLLIVVGLILINRILSKRLWRPFYHTLGELKKFKIENAQALQLKKTGIKEFNDLNNAITVLTSRNKEVYQSQKEFTENASHEMQTPLAVLQGKLDLLMQTNPLSKEQSELISDIADVNQRMNHLNKSLLLLTKIENNQFAGTENISIRQVLQQLIEQYHLQAEQKNISIKNDCSETIVIKANKALIEIMLGNLLSNAIRHNIRQGRIIITGDNAMVCFINTGADTALHPAKIFERFQKLTDDTNSIGLGLQIAKKIADHYLFTITYTFENQMHRFILQLK